MNERSSSLLSRVTSTRLLFGGVVVAGTLAGVGAVAQQTAATTTKTTTTPATASAIPFTKVQADTGAKTYAAQCAGCHGAKLEGNGFPPLTGVAFIKKWRRNTVDDFHYIMSTTMPKQKPGSLTAEEYLNIVAYVLQQNGLKPGKQPLKAADLKKYKMSVLTTAAPSK